MSELSEAVERLAEARAVEAVSKDVIGEIESEIQQRFGTVLAAAKKYLQDARTDIIRLEAQVRTQAIIRANRGSGRGLIDTKPHPAVGIGMYTVLKYEESDAIDHCRKHLPNALSLKKRDFEAVAKVAKLKFVSITTEPRAKIASDLSEWLPAAEDDDATAT